MTAEPVKHKKTDSLRRLRQAITLAALALALAHLLWPSAAIDAISLALIVIALVPWLAPIFKSLEFPGGWKIEFQDLQKATARAEQAGLLSPAPPHVASDFSFQRLAEEDPNLALAGLRIEIEKRLLKLAERHNIDVRSRGIGALLRSLSQHQVLTPEASSTLADMAGMLNSAVHGATVDPRGAEWALNIGPRVLRTLDDLAAEGPQPGS
jgi:hypothetical protein